MGIDAMKRLLVLALAASLTTACTVGRKYQRPAVDVPQAHRSASAPVVVADPTSLADLKWFEIFEDPALQELVRTALANNYDLRDAVARVEFARGQLGITRADQFPNVGASGDIVTERQSRSGAFEIPEPGQTRRTFGTVAVNLLTFELDIWGRLRRATERDRARMYAEEEFQKAIVVSLVAAVADSYFRLRELDLELTIAERTLGSRLESRRIIQLQESAGIATMLDVRQSEELVYTASASIPDIERAIGLQENVISTLVGVNPREISRGAELTAQRLPPEVPTGLPSDLIERRPDIRAAEQLLVAANADIGVAKAAYFPRISLTGFFGFQSDDLSQLFAGPTRVWSFVPQATQPIFTAGRLKGNVRSAEAQFEIALVEYERSIQNGFREVSDALIAYQKVREERGEQEKLVGALQDRVRLSNLRYEGGIDAYLSVLDSERELFDAEIDLARIRLDEVLTVVLLYKSLGGGWQQ
jgi:multidrug efflux system outer membrane protein